MTPEIDKARDELQRVLMAALPYAEHLVPRMMDAIDAYASAQIDLAVGMAGAERALESMEAPTEPQRNALPPPAPDAWIITNRRGDALHEVFEHEANARANAAGWYGAGDDAPVVRYVPASRLEEAQENLRKVGDFYGAPSKCACGEEGVVVDMTPGAETMRCAACGADRCGDEVQRSAYDALRVLSEGMRKALREIASGAGGGWATGVASRALAAVRNQERPIETPSTTCTTRIGNIEIVPAPGDRCGNTRRLPGGGACPGCRSCA